VFFLVLTRSRCAPGRLGTIDRFIPIFTVTDDDDERHEITTDESEDHTWSYYEDAVTDTTQDDVTADTTQDGVTADTTQDDVTESTTNEIPLESLVAHIDQLAGQGNGTTKGQFVYMNKTGSSITVLYVAGPSSSLAAYTAGD